jgi:carboxymethylenebutenolidase
VAASGTEIEISTDDGPMPAFAATPTPEVRGGGIIVVQEALGVTNHIRDVATRLAEAGWNAIAPALFHRQGSPVFEYEQADLVMPVLDQLSPESISVDLNAAFGYFEQMGLPVSRIGVVGFCSGGTVAHYAAAMKAFGASVTYYGGGVAEPRFGLPSALDLAPEFKTPWLGLYGELDEFIPVADVERLKVTITDSDVSAEIVIYPGAGHGFSCVDRPQHFNAEVAAQAWQRMLDWFDLYLVPQS